MVGWTRSGIVLVFAACFGFLILPGWTCSAAEEVKFRNVPFCDSLCAKYRVVFLLYLSGQTTETNFSLALNFIAHEIMACHESGATYYVEIYASGSNEWRTCCNLIDCAAQLALLRFNQTINSNITASQDEILVDHYDQYQMDLVLTETINNVKPWRYQKYVYLVADYGSDMVKKDQKRLNESAILNRIALRSFIIESENFHKREILEYFQSIGATPQKNFSQLVKSAEVVKVCGKQIRQAEFKYPAQCLESSTTSANTISTTTNTMTHNYNPSTPQARHQPHIGTKMTDTLINGALTTSQQSLIDRNQSLTSGVPLTHATQTTITDPFTQDLWIFIALSERANESDYQFVLNMTAEWILTQCNPQTNGSVFVFMPRSTTVTICSWSNTSQCISQLMNTSYETAIIEVDVIIVR
uniref:Uncharacterized protein n=1 Tax=Plectus sambesii TaxID=2011161 RepID=A0A914XA31_9BILA